MSNFYSGIEIHTHAMLPSCSQETLINAELANKLKVNGLKTTIKIKVLK